MPYTITETNYSYLEGITVEVSNKLISKFTEYILKGEDCWLWEGSILSSGYGNFHFEGKNYLAHRIAYLIETGFLDKSITISQSCGNKWCVNPNHLCAKSTSLFTKEEIKEICNRYSKGEKVNDLAKAYSVSHPLISMIVHGKIYKELTND
jgi:hypothetical protein